MSMDCVKNAPTEQKKTAEIYTPPQPTGKTGQELSTIYCGSCHAYAAPDMLDKKTWLKECLPNMGSRLGILTEGYNPVRGLSPMDEYFVLEANIYPKNPVMTQEDWQKIVDFYQNTAPNQLPPPPKQLPSFLHHPAPNVCKRISIQRLARRPMSFPVSIRINRLIVSTSPV